MNVAFFSDIRNQEKKPKKKKKKDSIGLTFPLMFVLSF